MQKLVFMALILAFSASAQAAVITEDERDVLRGAIYAICYDNARINAEYRAMGEQLHKDVAMDYCSCMATRMAEGAADEEAVYAAEYQNLAPSLETKLVLNFGECLRAAKNPVVASNQ